MTRFSVPQSEPPRSPRQSLPTMYDLPSEDPEEPGLPDEFHALQPQLLTRTFRSPRHSSERLFIGSDLNLYYNVRRPLWYKRPDWFLVLDVSRLYDDTDLRSSYVMWQEGVPPFVVVELLSPGTEAEDLGENAALEPESVSESEATAAPGEQISTQNGQTTQDTPPRKWDVYEQILRVPYYIVFSRYTNQLRFFQLVGGRYQEQPLDANNPRIWMTDLELGLGLWQGTFEGITRQWMRWFDAHGDWIATDAEWALEQAEEERQRAEEERQRANQAEQQLEQLLAKLRDRGIDPDSL
ncbi:Uma2 family endonuclease [Leptolyngbya sp. FACHB-36]|uniref:Uma2 family endonuclease n=1 Tax=Leptolyngbya sp. FACHB-36 TaxID=2692808 RepID=UPI001680B97C|nr:Uma2 family endonuclease [Leptolyngbya sp. FACHB-36]MBD2021578.1 Uma2 family endonuclease [Leptolyngbya sp. FACHB-36]